MRARGRAAVAKETDGFAGRLGELKERSGRSYGALARQLHMSTSTLHRYCNGDAVPTDYAPVERFARLCGATSDELVELHRQWILADEARRRGRPGQAGPAARNAPADGRDPAPVRDAASAPGRAADVLPDGNADADAVRKAAREPAGQDENGDAADDVAREPAGQDADGGPARSEPRPGARRRRFRVAVAAAAVAALAVPAAFAVDRIGGDAPAPDPRGEARQDALGKAEAGPRPMVHLPRRPRRQAPRVAAGHPAPRRRVPPPRLRRAVAPRSGRPASAAVRRRASGSVRTTGTARAASTTSWSRSRSRPRRRRFRRTPGAGRARSAESPAAICGSS
ncbi:helix-turn-helix domain-containing protein [Streptomyces sp. NPDC087659]|uniref:helix-turn-helix domain-containing protein n=1 Tax=Streptomyces sp. NPDC087659 TaxID=3365801 RepID=UPI00382C6750